MAHHDVVTIGTSAGGFSALKRLLASMPPAIDATVLVVLHLKSDSRSTLAEILDRVSPLPVQFAEDDRPMERNHVYVAPPNRHLLIDGKRLILGAGPWENNSRPAIDPLFRSAALCCGPRVIGTLLTGYLNDGSSGLRAIKRCGGIAVVQDPADAEYPDMPKSALNHVEVDHVVGLDDMPELLIRLIASPAGKAHQVPNDLRLEVGIAMNGKSDIEATESLGKRSLLACPDCHGVMWEIDDGKVVRYRCHVGHAYTAHSLGLALRDDLSRAVGSALRALEERAVLVRRLADQAREQSRSSLAEQWEEKAKTYDEQADLVRRLLIDVERPGPEEDVAS